MKKTLTVWSALAVFGAFCVASVASAATPTANEVAKLVADDAALVDQFGYSVAVDGDTAVIGARLDDNEKGVNAGAVYVFTRSAGGWMQQNKLLASDGAGGDQFGFSVALDGDTVVIGAIDDNSSPGSAYVFTRSAGAWMQQAKLLAADGAAGHQFGHSVAIDGDTAVVGARFDDNEKGVNAGAAYVYTRSAGAWTQQAKLLASDGAPADEFGFSVALDGDTAVSGARYDFQKRGSAYVFARDSSGNWVEQQKLTASDPGPNERFGSSVAVDGDTALVGAEGDNGVGAAYVYTRVGAIWTEQEKLVASDGAFNDFFGFAVALEGNTAVVGAHRNDGGGSSDSGAVYSYIRDPSSNWSEAFKLLPSVPQRGAFLGFSVDISGGTVLGGAPLYDLTGATNAGAAYVFSVITDDEGPITSNVLATPNPVAVSTTFSITAMVDDTTTGNSAIASAAYTVNSAGPYPMGAADGNFDSSVENVTATVGGLDVGVYELCVSGTDEVGNTGAAECTMLAVYDPTAGFVTGGGWIQSPAGAYLPDPSLIGKANFGFVSRYKKGANVPDGNTQFVFHAGGMSFHSSSYEWLVVAGGKAQFKGVGTINGAGNFGFIIFATDAGATSDPADVDSFRIQIWDRDNADAPVYDNGVEQVLGGGSIVVHTGGKKK